MQILFATGRKPRTKDIGLEDVGVKFDDKGKLEVRSSGHLSIHCESPTMP